MKYSHAVKSNGKFYPPNTEVPEKKPATKTEPKKKADK